MLVKLYVRNVLWKKVYVRDEICNRLLSFAAVMPFCPFATSRPEDEPPISFDFTKIALFEYAYSDKTCGLMAYRCTDKEVFIEDKTRLIYLPDRIKKNEKLWSKPNGKEENKKEN